MTQVTSLFCKYIKFTNGDNIVCLTDDACENLSDTRSITVMDPMMVTPVRIPRMGKILESYVLHPWLPLTDEKVVEINTASIISAVEARDTFREQYEAFIDQQNKAQDAEELEEAEELEITQDLARAQELLKTLATTDHEEDDDNDDGHWNSPSRTLH